MRRFVFSMIVALAGGILLWSEFVHWRASKRALRAGGSHPGIEAVIVLGVKNRREHANYLNRYRVRAALRSQTTTGESVLTICGGAVGGATSEAELMAHYATDSRGYEGAVRLDRESLSTWANVANAVPLIENAGVIKIVSNSMHAERAREYLWKMRPDLAHRLVRGDDYRFGEILWLEPVLAYVGLRKRRPKMRVRALEPSVRVRPAPHTPPQRTLNAW